MFTSHCLCFSWSCTLAALTHRSFFFLMQWIVYTFLSSVGFILAYGNSQMKCLHLSARESDVWSLSVGRLVSQEISWAFRNRSPYRCLAGVLYDIRSLSISGAISIAFFSNLPMYARLIDACDSLMI